MELGIKKSYKMLTSSKKKKKEKEKNNGGRSGGQNSNYHQPPLFSHIFFSNWGQKFGGLRKKTFQFHHFLQKILIM